MTLVEKAQTWFKNWLEKISTNENKEIKEVRIAKVSSIVVKIVVLISKLTVAMLVWWILEEIFPALRETIPSWYKLVDLFWMGVECLFQSVLKPFGI